MIGSLDDAGVGIIDRHGVSTHFEHRNIVRGIAHRYDQTWVDAALFERDGQASRLVESMRCDVDGETGRNNFEVGPLRAC